ncbi:MAG: hypothetical protein JEZ09_19525 [Salinivirgaceae bacterium]|nr:hypothetical protein [Salinivirgaceae bacterium]
MKYFFILVQILFFCLKLHSQNSVLADGNWIKIRIDSSNVYKLPFDSLKVWGFENPENISIYCNVGKQLLPSTIYSEETDLIEVPLYKKVVYDNILGELNYYLFYAEGSTIEDNKFTLSKHEYDNYNYYYITDIKKGKRVNNYNLPEIGFKDTVRNHRKLFHYEEWNNYFDNNFSHYYGQFLYSDSILTIVPEFNNFIKDQYSIGEIWFENVFNKNNATIKCMIGNIDTIIDINQNTILYLYNKIMLPPKKITIELTASNDNKPILLKSIDIKLTETISFNSKNEFFNFYNWWNINDSNYVYISSESDDLNLWLINKYSEIENIPLTKLPKGYVFPFTELYRTKFVCFKDNLCKVPENCGSLSNQNLKNLSSVNYLIISPPEFQESADRLADFRYERNNLSALVVNTDKIYNEFSSGKVDPIAIRNFIKHIYDKGKGSKENLEYVVLFGDGRAGNIANNSFEYNFIPVYRSYKNGDNLYGVMEDIEHYITNGKMDIAVGRLPIRNRIEAKGIVDKIINYEDDYGAWRNNMTLIAGNADNEQSATFFKTVDYFAEEMSNNLPHYIINKTYLDGIEDCFVANDSILNLLNMGQSVIGYFGHSNISGWDDGLLNTQLVSTIVNKHYPHIISNSCNFAEFDNQKQSIAESWLLNPNGGAISVIGGTRYVGGIFNDNDLDVTNFLNLLTRIKEFKTIGKALLNDNCFDGKVLLGDPALSLYNFYKISNLNLSKIGIDYYLKGEIAIETGSRFNGKLICNYFLPPSSQILYDVDNSPQNIENSNSLLYFDSTTITNGVFNMKLPPVINHLGLDSIRIVLYAQSINNEEAVGNFVLPKLYISNTRKYSLIYPTIVEKGITIITKPDKTLSNVYVIDNLGTKCYNISSLDRVKNFIDLSALSTGFKIISVTYKDGKRESFKIVKQ